MAEQYYGGSKKKYVSAHVRKKQIKEMLQSYKKGDTIRKYSDEYKKKEDLQADIELQKELGKID